MDEISLDLMTVAEAAEALSVSPNTVHQMIRDGLLRSIRPSKRTTRVRRADVEAILEEAT